ncbi:alpha/beta hydrolase [Sphingomonas sp. HF-S3]|uniref:Alpha/beta hydrolase n=1 Tax=Sphingomonas rustica TaxID=3103142 RepID=A0ABV0B6X6_9SPHN
MKPKADVVHSVSLSRRAVLGGAIGVALAGSVEGLAAVAAEPEKRVLAGPGGREIAVWRWAPAGKLRGTVSFSHGAASAPWKYARLLQPWADAGYEILAPLHVDSTDHPRTAEFAGLASWRARIEDMRTLAATIGSARFIAAGHSYGALTALTMGGAEAVMPEGLGGIQREPRVAAVVAFSPPGAIEALIPASGYARLAVPALIQTGDKDVPIGGTDPAGWRGHLDAYEAARAGGDRYALVLDGVDHYFGGLICRELPGPPQTAQLGQAIDLSTLFMRGFLNRDSASRRKLDSYLGEAGPVRLTRK